MSSIKVHPMVAAIVVLLMMLLIYRNITCSNVTLDSLTNPPITNPAIPLNNAANIGSGSSTTNLRSETSQQLSKEPSQLNLAPAIELFPDACKKFELWGRDHHGGWYICMDLLPTEKCIVYSYGLGADWSFDNAAEKFGCEVHGFDPSAALWAQGMHGRDYSNIDYANQYPSAKKHFHNWGVGAASEVTYPSGTIPQEWPGLGDPQLSKTNTDPWLTKSIEKTIRELGHDKSQLTILKIDVEGAEWDALWALFDSATMKDYILNGNIPQLLAEYHWDPDSRLRNARNEKVMNRIKSMGFIPWKVTRHEGSDCCLDVNYVWAKK